MQIYQVLNLDVTKFSILMRSKFSGSHAYIMVKVFHDLVESELVLVKGDRLHSYATIHAHYTRLVLKYRSYMVYRTRYEYRTEYY